MRVRELRLSWYPTGQHVDGRRKLTAPRQAADLLRPLLEHEASEVFMILLLDTKAQIIGIHTVSRGTLDEALVHPREVFKAALLGNASTIVTAHNHPSGDVSPSPDDIALWHRLNAAGEIIGVEPLDHLIIGDNGRYYSWMDARRLP